VYFHAVRIALLILALAGAARAQLHHRLALWGGVDVTVSPEAAAHGIGRIRYELSGLPRQSRFVVDFNSDTLRLSYEGLRVGRFEIGFVAGGEVYNAGLLGDYWRQKQKIGARGFRASWADAGAYFKLDFAPSFLELAINVHKWFFNREDGTEKSLILPPEAWVGQWRLRYTLWMLAPDPSLWEAQRPFARIEGIALGLEVGVDARSEVRPWGARNDAVPDLRNDPSALVWSARQWVRAGVRVGARVRFQLEEFAQWMEGEDDLDRARVGSLNPYVVPIAGLPWASQLAGKLASAQITIPVRVWREIEVGPLLGGAVIDDVDRTGKSGAVGGIGAFVDFRFRGWQADVRGGWSPPAGGSLFFSLGWGWFR
jgi:hypothetical protein